IEYCYLNLNYRNGRNPPIGGIPYGGGVPYPPPPIPSICGAGKASGCDCEHERLSDSVYCWIHL
ncbi:unnamed protein product, partial [Brassica oleracea]